MDPNTILSQSNKRIYIIVLALFIFILILLLIYFALNRRNNTNQVETPQPTIVNLAEVTITTVPNEVSPIPAADTGGLGTEFTEEEENNINQERALRRISPYSADQFSVNYNYNTDLFDVTYNSASDSAQIAFEEWKTNQYPAIPFDRFNRPN